MLTSPGCNKWGLQRPQIPHIDNDVDVDLPIYSSSSSCNCKIKAHPSLTGHLIPSYPEKEHPRRASILQVWLSGVPEHSGPVQRLLQIGNDPSSRSAWACASSPQGLSLRRDPVNGGKHVRSSDRGSFHSCLSNWTPEPGWNKLSDYVCTNRSKKTLNNYHRPSFQNSSKIQPPLPPSFLLFPFLALTQTVRSGREGMDIDTETLATCIITAI